jgi:hypothetical protein
VNNVIFLLCEILTRAAKGLGYFGLGLRPPNKKRTQIVIIRFFFFFFFKKEKKKGELYALFPILKKTLKIVNQKKSN